MHSPIIQKTRTISGVDILGVGIRAMAEVEPLGRAHRQLDVLDFIGGYKCLQGLELIDVECLCPLDLALYRKISRVI